MKRTIIVSVAILIHSVVMAQGEHKHKNEKLESMRVGMITNKLNLSAEQAQKFWPLYNDFRAQKELIKKEMDVFKDVENKTDSEYLKAIDKMQELRLKDVQIDGDYKDKFLKVISPKQLVELYKAERKFMLMLMKHLEDDEIMREHPNRPPHPNQRGPKHEDEESPLID